MVPYPWAHGLCLIVVLIMDGTLIKFWLHKQALRVCLNDCQAIIYMETYSGICLFREIGLPSDTLLYSMQTCMQFYGKSTILHMHSQYVSSPSSSLHGWDLGTRLEAGSYNQMQGYAKWYILESPISISLVRVG